MTLAPDYSNIASVPFVSMALQTQEEINSSYMRKMNRDYASHIGSITGTIPITIPTPITHDKEKCLEQESS